MDSLTFTTAQAESTEPVIAAVFNYLASKLDVSVSAVHDISWQERIQQVGDGRIDVGWICGSHYTRLAAAADPTVELLAAPVMKQARYQGEPVYFSDVVVRKDSPFQSFEDLRGRTFAYNEPGSMSGYWSMRYHLARLREYDGFFGRVVQSGGHLNSIGMILEGEVDTAAIDSMVMAPELLENPGLAAKIRVVDVLGPTPIPPWVVRRALPEPLKAGMRQALIEMHEDGMGRRVLESLQMQGFSAVGDGYYDRVREMVRDAVEVNW